MVIKIVLNAAQEMLACIAPVDIMVAVSVYLHIKLDVCLHKSLCQFGCVLVVHIVISRAMNDEEVTMELAVAVQRRAIIARRILLRRAHETLGVS